MHEIDMFLMGLKPAVYCIASEREFQEVQSKLATYPYVTDGIDLFDNEDFFLFFQTEEAQQNFSKRQINVQPRSIGFHRLLGNALGFPPEAVNFYAQCVRYPELKKYKVGMHYMGIGCNGSLYDLKENCLWLWDTYAPASVSDKLEIRVDTKMLPVEYGDISRLAEIEEIALHTQVENTVTA